MFYTTPVLVFPSNTVIAQYKTYYEQNRYVTNIFINFSLGHISNTSTRLEVRSVHESTTKSPTNKPLWLLPRLTHEEEHHSTHTYLASFRSIHSRFLMIK